MSLGTMFRGELNPQGGSIPAAYTLTPLHYYYCYIFTSLETIFKTCLDLLESNPRQVEGMG